MKMRLSFISKTAHPEEFKKVTESNLDIHVKYKKSMGAVVGSLIGSEAALSNASSMSTFETVQSNISTPCV